MHRKQETREQNVCSHTKIPGNKMYNRGNKLYTPTVCLKGTKYKK